MNNLALLYQVQGRFGEAEPLYRRSLAIREKALGPDDLAVAVSFNNLASLHKDQGRFAEAEPLFRRSLAIREKALGPNHPDVGLSLNNLAELYREQSRFGEAEPLYNRSLWIWEKALGVDHPEALRRSMLALMARTDKPYFAHPAFWAPFVLVGEGSSLRR